jgi:hypothetical protein
MISHSPKASIRVACRHASSLAYITMPPCHCFDQDLISSPSKDLSFRHTTRQFIRQQREGKSLSLLISAICMEGIADSLHRHITDAHFPALQDRLSLCGTKALWNERRGRVQSETTRHHVCRRTLSRCNALFRHHHEIEQNDKICQITRGSQATANRCHEQITVPANAMTTAHLIRNKCIEFEDDNEEHIHFCEQLKEALRATQAAGSASASQTRTAPTVRTSHS